MIYIFHGNNQLLSRQAFTDKIESYKEGDTLRLDAKDVSLDKVNLFLNSTSLFLGQKILSISNFFSVSKPILDKLTKIIQSNSGTIILWQDKQLNATQKKLFPQAKVIESSLPKTLFVCLNAIKPGNFKTLIPLLRLTLKNEPYDLFLYLLKDNLRKGILSSSRFEIGTLKKAYLSLIELDFQTKTGTLSIPKEIALERILLNLTK